LERQVIRRKKWGGMAKYEVGEFHFASKSKVKKILSSALAELDDGEQVTDPFVADLLTALAREHPEAADKVGAGIEYWVAASNKDSSYRTRGFRAKQWGRAEPVLFGYTKILDKPDRQGLVAEALTQEALDITQRFRTDAFANGPVECARTGKMIPDKTMADAVHLTPPRGVLHAAFLKSEGLTHESVQLKKHPVESGYRLVDRELAERWRTFQEERLDGMAIVLRRER
jgi:hypothetical protein